MSNFCYRLAETFKGFFLLSFFTLVLACASNQKVIYDARFQEDLDKMPIPIPEETKPGEYFDHLYNKSVRYAHHVFDIPGWGRALGQVFGANTAKQAENINAWDEVPDSSWFTNRIGRSPLSTEKIRAGAKTSAGPDTSNPWTIIRGKTDGVSAGFTIKDSLGDMYFIKFDPPGHQELSSAAETISSLILHSAGYNVPAYYVLSVPLNIFELSKKAKIRGKYGVKRKMTDNDLAFILKKVESNDRGYSRISASKALEGRPIGPFMYEGKRGDDANDRINHQHRRELRGYPVFGAWLNNTDLRFQNTLDMYIGKPGSGYVRHNMLDFGTSLGSAGYRGKTKNTGYEALVDYSEIGKNIVSFGFREPYWVNVQKTKFKSVGIFESTIFDPLKWRTQYGNLAFDFMTNRDAFWATKIIMKFNDEHISTIVREAKYSNPDAEKYVIDTLKQRRDKIGKTWFSRITPLDEFSLIKNLGKWQLTFTDLAVQGKLVSNKTRRYKINGQDNHNLRVNSRGVGVINFNKSALVEENTVKLDIMENEAFVGKGVSVNIVCRQTTCIIAGISRL